MLKQLTTLSLTLGLLLLGGTATANQPSDITYKSGGSNGDEKFSTYLVRCTDGSNRTISAWDDRKKWCVGTSKSNCTNDQLKTAKRACGMPKSK